MHEVSLSEIVELPIISPKISKRNTQKKRLSILTSTTIKDQLEEKENRKRSKAEEIKIKNKINRIYAKTGSQIKILKCSDKIGKRVLKHFKNIKDFNDPSQNTKEKEKGEKESEDYFCII